MDASQIYRWALTQDVVVSRIIVAHNHPSGDATPSDADIAVTRRIVQVGRQLGVPCLDHLIVAGVATTSIREVHLDLFDAPAFDSCLT